MIDYSTYPTLDHQIFIYGQQRADGWACRKEGCEWQTHNWQWDRDVAQMDHDWSTGTQ